MKTHLFYVMAVCFTFFSIHLSSQININSTNYTSLQSAFNAINTGIHTGDISVIIQASTNETGTAILNASGTGSANYTSVTIFPDVAGCEIIGNVNGSLIELNGSDNVIIDGRVNRVGNMNLLIENTSTSTSATAITLNNDATNNQVLYTDIRGSAPTINDWPSTASRSVVFFGNLANSFGNSFNIITYCNIGPSGSNLPGTGILSYGSSSAGLENKENIIDNCNIFDFFYNYTNGGSSGTFDAGIYLAYYGNTSWIITNNSFYQTNARNKSNNNTANNISAIYIASGDGYIIENNFIGGSAPKCEGNPMTYTGNAYLFHAIKFRGGNIRFNTVNQINNNTIQNISFSSGNTSSSTNNSVPRFSALHFSQGKIRANGNVVGSPSMNDNIILQHTNSTFCIYDIWVPQAYSNYIVNVESCNRNFFGGITIDATYFDSKIFHFESYAGNSTDSVCFNTIGSETLNSSIKIALTTPSVTRNTFQAIFMSSVNAGSRIICNNKISNISRGSGSTDLFAGIRIFASDVKIQNNTIQNLHSANGSDIYGIYSNGNNANISSNFIHRIGSSFNSSNQIIGICSDGSSGGQVYNNIISLGLNPDGSSCMSRSFAGIRSRYATDIKYNTIILQGLCISGDSYAYYDYFNSSGRNITNNIFCNTRENISGIATHYAAYLYSLTGLNIDYNDYFVDGSCGGMTGYLSANLLTLAQLKSATGQDMGSTDIYPSFVDKTGFLAVDFKLTSGTLQGIFDASVVIDFAGGSRTSGPTMGAWEYAVNKWIGFINQDFNTAGNWSRNYVPLTGENLEFDISPVNHCQLDKDRTIGNIINCQSSYNFSLNGNELTLLGNLNFSNGAYIDASTPQSALNFSGSNLQIIENGAILNNIIPHLTINNSSGLLINTEIKITEKIVLTNGIINTNGYIINLENGIIVEGGANNSYINGKCRKIGNEAFTFPIGKGKYAPIGITAPDNVNDHFTAEYFNQNPSPTYNGSSLESGLNNISSVEYWTLDRTGGASNVNVILFWDSDSGVSLPEDLRVGRWDGSIWLNEGNIQWSGNPLSGNIKSNVLSQFSPFTFASTSSNNTLPLELIDFNAVQTKNDVYLFWKMASELNYDYYIIEHSSDNKNWIPIGDIHANTNNNQIAEYTMKHESPISGSNYYRLSVVTVDGIINHSHTIYLQFTVYSEISVYPVPATDFIQICHNNIIQDEYLFGKITDITGKIVIPPFIIETKDKYIDISNLKAGFYTVHVYDSFGEQKIKLIKR